MATEKGDAMEDIEQIPAQVEDDDDDDEATGEETEDVEAGAGEAAGGEAKGDEEEDDKGKSRSEKKARRAILKLGLKPVTGVKRVVLRRNRQTFFAIQSPDVFKLPNSDTYVVFGEAQVDDPAVKAAREAASKYTAHSSSAGYAAGGSGPAAGEGAKPSIEEEGEDEEVDDAGLEENDIKMIMEQTNVSRTKAVKALKEHSNDLVNAIMSLTV